MSLKVRRATTIAICLLALGCAETPSNPSPHYVETPEPNVTRTILVISDPPGARVEVNDDYVGDAPCSIRVRCNDDGRFFDKTTITALPVNYGYTQTKHFNGIGEYSTIDRGEEIRSASDRIPSRIFFNMDLGPVAPDINVNVNE